MKIREAIFYDFASEMLLSKKYFKWKTFQGDVDDSFSFE